MFSPLRSWRFLAVPGLPSFQNLVPLAPKLSMWPVKLWPFIDSWHGFVSFKLVFLALEPHGAQRGINGSRWLKVALEQDHFIDFGLSEMVLPPFLNLIS